MHKNVAFVVFYSLVFLSVHMKSFCKKKNCFEKASIASKYYTTDVYSPKPTYQGFTFLVIHSTNSSHHTYLFTLIFICQNFFYFLKIYFHLTVFIFICQNFYLICAHINLSETICGNLLFFCENFLLFVRIISFSWELLLFVKIIFFRDNFF